MDLFHQHLHAALNRADLAFAAVSGQPIDDEQETAWAPELPDLDVLVQQYIATGECQREGRPWTCFAAMHDHPVSRLEQLHPAYRGFF